MSATASMDQWLAEYRLIADKRGLLERAGVDSEAINGLVIRFTARRIRFVVWTAGLRGKRGGWVVRALERDWSFGSVRRQRRRTQ